MTLGSWKSKERHDSYLVDSNTRNQNEFIFIFVLFSLSFINRNNCFHFTWVSINIVSRSHVLPGLVYWYKNSQNIHMKYAFFGFSLFKYWFRVHGNCSWVEIINWINLQSDEEWHKVWKHDNFKCRNKHKNNSDAYWDLWTYLTCIYLRNIYHFSCNKLSFFLLSRNHKTRFESVQIGLKRVFKIVLCKFCASLSFSLSQNDFILHFRLRTRR